MLGVGIAALILAGVDQVLHRAHHSPPVDPKALALRLAHTYEQQGLMSAADSERLDGLSGQIASTGKVSDADFAWAVALMDRPLKPEAAPELHVQVMDTLLRAQFLTASQKDRLYRTAEPWATAPEQNGSGLDRVEFATVVATLHDMRGVSALKAMGKDHDPDVARQAKVALDSLAARQLRGAVPRSD